MHRWAFPRSASAPKPAPISIFFFCCCCFPPRSGEWTAGHKTWPRSPAAVTGAKCRHDGGNKHDRPAVRCQLRGPGGSVKRSLPSTTQGRPSARYTIALVALCMIDFERPLDHRSLSRFLLEPSAVTTDD